MERILQEWRTAGRPIFHIRHDSSNPASPLHPTHKGNAHKPRLAPFGDEPLITKNVNSAFIGTDLESRLRDRGITEVVLIGLTTPHCVSTTARMAGNLGFRTIVVSDATAAFEVTAPDGKVIDPELVHYHALAAIHGEFAEVITTEELLH